MTSKRDQFRQWLLENSSEKASLDEIAEAAERIYAGPGEADIHPWGFSYCVERVIPWGFSYCVERVISSKCNQYLSRDGLWMQERTCYDTRAEAEAALAKAKEPTR